MADTTAVSHPAAAARLPPMAEAAKTAAGRRPAPSKRRRQRLEGGGDLLSPNSSGDLLSPNSDGRGALFPSSGDMEVSATPSGGKRKKTHLTGTPVVEQLQPSNETRADAADEGTDYGHDWDMDEGTDYGHDWDEEDEGNDADWEWQGDDMDEGERTDCVEGVIEPEMVDGFLNAEENRQFRSEVWNEFTKICVGGIVVKGQCAHCDTLISAKRGAGTSAMGTHLKRCKARRKVTNLARQLKSAVMSPEGVSLDNWRFSQDTSRRELNRMISLHGLPLSIVDYDGFRRFVSSLNLVFKMNSRRTISRDCLKIFQEKKQVLQEIFRNTNNRVSLTMDMWTSNQTIGYMCVTSHFIDEHWMMQKRIIKFSFMKTPHSGVAMLNVLLKSLQDWKIEDKLFAITLDNASNNNAMVKLLRKNLLDKYMLHGKGKLLHTRCAAHVLNLICKAGFEIINPIMHKVRESVKFVKGSTSRKQKFEEIIQQLGIQEKKRPNIDVSTRWNSTYLMLEICFLLKRAFDSLTKHEPEYIDLPSSEEWEKARIVCDLLKTFYDATKLISGSLYPTSNLYFHELWEVKVALEKGIAEADADLPETVKYMHRKFSKYWKLTWLHISFPVILDPQFKFGFIEFRLKQAFGSDAGSKVATLKKVLVQLLRDYSQTNHDSTSAEITQSVATGSSSARYADWDQHLYQTTSSTSERPSELELETYLAKPTIPRVDSFDILNWWKSNSAEYPILSRIARDVLAVPASTVPSESAFSIGRRTISDFRSRLTPNTVEALICNQDWIRADSGSSQFCTKSIDDFIELADQPE